MILVQKCKILIFFLRSNESNLLAEAIRIIRPIKAKELAATMIVIITTFIYKKIRVYFFKLVITDSNKKNYTF